MSALINIKKEKLSPTRVKEEKTVNKSSSEILTELFGVFNAKPPEIEESPLYQKKSKKSKKKHKKDKKSKKKKRHLCTSGSENDGDSRKSKIKREETRSRKRRAVSSESELSLTPPPKQKAYNSVDTSSLLNSNCNRQVEVDLDDLLVVKNENKEPNNVHRDKAKRELALDIPIPSAPDVSKINLPNDTVKDKKKTAPTEQTDKSKGKIQIKNLKFSSVFEANVKQAEEQARKKAEKYEEGEYSDTSTDSDYKYNNVDNSEFPKSSDPGGILKKKSLEAKKNEEKSERKCKSSSGRRRHSHYSDKESRHRSRRRSQSKSPRRSRTRERRSSSRRHRSRHRSKTHSRTRRRSRSRSRVRLAETEKRRLLEVARRNAINMLRSGAVSSATATLPSQKVMAAIKFGGKSVDELTDFCKHLSKKEALGELSSVSSSDCEGLSDNEDTRAFHHPFLVKEKTPIVMNIRGGAPLPVRMNAGQSSLTPQNKDELRLQFPVSSGTDHRASEWRPVTPPLNKKETVVALVKPGPKPVAGITNYVLPEWSAPELPIAVPKPIVAPPIVPPATPMEGFTGGAALSTVIPLPVLPAPGPQAYPDGMKAQEKLPEAVDIDSLVAQRLSAIRKLQAICAAPENNPPPMGWRPTENNLGQFMGSTGAQILTPKELASGSQAWAKKDQLQKAAPVAGGMGMHLLQKMGWQPGQGLGKEGTGSLTPLMLEVKLDTRGLVAKEELKQPPRATRRGAPPPGPAPGLPGGKHPVSLLGEYCSKHKLTPPEYELCFECGPDHKKNFLFKVKVNGIEYQPAVASANKKQAKADAAQIALQKLGIAI